MNNNHPLFNQVRQNVANANQLKAAIADLQARIQGLGSAPVVNTAGNLYNKLAKILPEHLIPSNVGPVNNVQWPFHFSVDFDLTTTPDWPNITANTKLISSFQVTQESAFIFMSITRYADDYNVAGDLGPLSVEFRDRQSSRFFNNAPIPIQMIGRKAWPTLLPTPFIIMPNAIFDIELTSHLAQGVSQATPNGSTGIHQITFSGYRIRVEDADKVLSSVFG